MTRPAESAVRSEAKLARAILSSPLGSLEVSATAEAVVSARFLNVARRPRPPGEDAPAALRLACRELQAYFEGSTAPFTAPVAPAGTAFQLAVWRALRAIPRGHTRSYREVAEAAGRPSAARSAGAACGANPIPILIPCHRVLGADGSLTGFSAGLDRKRWLLEFEGALLRL